MSSGCYVISGSRSKVEEQIFYSLFKGPLLENIESILYFEVGKPMAESNVVEKLWLVNGLSNYGGWLQS
jgi:hypothetical protein